MTPKHTPGPWRVVKRANQTGLKMVAVDTHSANGTEQNVCDAHLIAAAPELLEALESMYAMTVARVPQTSPIRKDACAKARAAIAKAKGGA